MTGWKLWLKYMLFNSWFIRYGIKKNYVEKSGRNGLFTHQQQDDDNHTINSTIQHIIFLKFVFYFPTIFNVLIVCCCQRFQKYYWIGQKYIFSNKCLSVMKCRLQDAGLRGREAKWKQHRRLANKRKRWWYVNEHKHGTMLWTVESQFEVFGLNRRTFVRYRTNQRCWRRDCIFNSFGN